MAEHDEVVVKHVDDIEVGDNITSRVPGEWGVVKRIRRNIVAVIWFENGDFIVIPEQEEPLLTVVVPDEVVNTQPGDEVPPTEQSVGNHHWPHITNVYEAHGNVFPAHHIHKFKNGRLVGPEGLKFIHQHNQSAAHAESAKMHEPKGEDGCR